MFIILFLYFARMIVHYIMQYFLLKFMNVPVTKFRPLWYRIDLVYAPWLFSQDAAVVALGIVSNTILFILIDFLTFLVKRYCKCMPKIWYKVIAYYGAYAFLDPFIVLFLDTVSGNW